MTMAKLEDEVNSGDSGVYPIVRLVVTLTSCSVPGADVLNFDATELDRSQSDCR